MFGRKKSGASEPAESGPAGMDCPTCGRAMIRGRLCSDQGFSLEFLEAGADPLFLSEEDAAAAGGVVLAPRRMLRIGSISCGAWHCPDCKRIVIDYREDA